MPSGLKRISLHPFPFVFNVLPFIFVLCSCQNISFYPWRLKGLYLFLSCIELQLWTLEVLARVILISSSFGNNHCRSYWTGESQRGGGDRGLTQRWHYGSSEQFVFSEWHHKNLLLKKDATITISYSRSSKKEEFKILCTVPFCDIGPLFIDLLDTYLIRYTFTIILKIYFEVWIN